MSSDFDYKLLRTKADFTDDVDFAATQVAPVDADTAVVAYPDQVGNVIRRGIQIEIVIEWLSNALAVVAGAGSFTLQVVRVIDRPLAISSTPGAIVVDSVGISGRGSRPILIGDMRAGDQFGVRLSGITGPGGGATKLRVLYREVQA